MANAVTASSTVCDSLIAATATNVSYFALTEAEAITLLNEAKVLPQMMEKLKIFSDGDKFGPPFSIDELASNFSDYSSSIKLVFNGIPIRVG